VEYERHLANSLVNSLKSLKAETFPVCRIYTVDITDTSCEEVTRFGFLFQIMETTSNKVRE